MKFSTAGREREGFRRSAEVRELQGDLLFISEPSPTQYLLMENNMALDGTQLGSFKPQRGSFIVPVEPSHIRVLLNVHVVHLPHGCFRKPELTAISGELSGCVHLVT